MKRHVNAFCSQSQASLEARSLTLRVRQDPVRVRVSPISISRLDEDFVSLFQIRRQHIFDPFHECADSARQIAPMRHDEGHGETPATKIGYDLHKRSSL